MKIKCLYGDRCRFAHGSGELRNVDSPGTRLSHFFKTKLCYFFEGDQRRFWNNRSRFASREMAVLSEQLELLRTEKHKADVEHVRKEHALNLKVEAMSKDKVELNQVNSDLQCQIESLLERLEEQDDEIRLLKNEALENLDQIHRLEKQLSDKSTEILQHKYETLQKTETKQNTTIKEDVWDWRPGWGFSGGRERKR